MLPVLLQGQLAPAHRPGPVCGGVPAAAGVAGGRCACRGSVAFAAAYMGSSGSCRHPPPSSLASAAAPIRVICSLASRVPCAGEYLCPICRRLGNCLLPAAAPPQPDSALPAEGQPAAPLSSTDALAQLQQLLQAGPGNWASAPATSSGELRQRWQEAQAQGGAGPGIDVSLQLVPRFGSQAAGVVALAQDARAAASKWLSQQHRALDWLQLKGAGRC